MQELVRDANFRLEEVLVSDSSQPCSTTRLARKRKRWTCLRENTHNGHEPFTVSRREMLSFGCCQIHSNLSASTFVGNPKITITISLKTMRSGMGRFSHGFIERKREREKREPRALPARSLCAINKFPIVLAQSSLWINGETDICVVLLGCE